MVYINNVYTGLLVFPFIAALFTLPYAVYQYNRHGSVSKYRTLIIAGQLMNVRVAFAVDLIILALTAASRIYFIIYFINVVVRKGKLMPHDKLSRTLYMVTGVPEYIIGRWSYV